MVKEMNKHKPDIFYLPLECCLMGLLTSLIPGDSVTLLTLKGLSNKDIIFT